MTKLILFFGFGYTAKYISDLFLDSDYNLYGTSRDKSKKNLSNNKVQIIDFDIEAVSQILPSAHHLIISIPPSQQGKDPVLGLFDQIISNYAQTIESIIYLSATSVYGDHKGLWVNEQTDIIPSGQRADLRYKAELAWQKFAKQNQINIKILRLAGIYGPYRNSLTQIKNNTARSIQKKGQVFSRIHVKDIASTVKFMITQCNTIEGIFNLCDDFPCSTVEVNNYAAKLLNVPPPIIIDFNDAELSEMAKDFYSNCRKVSNKKLKKLLGTGLIYPDYKAGLENILKTNEY